MAYAKWWFSDYNGDQGAFKVPLDAVDETTMTAVGAALIALQTAVDGITIGTRTGRDFCAWEALGNASPNPSPLAQRQIQYQVQYHRGTDTNDTGTFTFPCADLSLLVANTEYIDITAGEGLAIKNGFEALMASAVTVDAIRYISKAK